MMLKLKHNRQELFVYALLWSLLLLAPVVGHFVTLDRQGNMPFGWDDVLHVWQQYLPFFLVFLVHNFLLAPLLLERQRRWLYFSLAALLVAVFVAVQCSHQPPQQFDGHPFAPDDREHFRPDEDMNGFNPFRPDEDPSRSDGGHEFRPERTPRFAPGHEGERPPMIFGQHDVVSTIVLILMLGMNIGVKLYFRQRKDRRRLAQLEKQNLEQQLEYLRYQINPHFLMNTLNNIHALVDFDAERAKQSIVDLSKIMRFMLYEGDKPTVPLGRELDFTRDYIALMSMRYTDRVEISVDIPQQVPDAQLPPLVLITFVENAFKHGISYRQQSFIRIKVSFEEQQLHFSCANSRVPRQSNEKGGVGLQNVRRRLDLIYGEHYTLRIEDQPDRYNIQLVLPL